MINKEECLDRMEMLMGRLELLEDSVSLTVKQHANGNSDILLNKIQKLEMHISHVEKRLSYDKYQTFDLRGGLQERAIS